MASSKEYLDYILDCLSGLDEITTRKMMGEYMIYFRSKLVGGIYDNRFLVKDLPSAQRLMPDAPRELPYEGAKPMLLVENAEDSFLYHSCSMPFTASFPHQSSGRKRIKKGG